MSNRDAEMKIFKYQLKLIRLQAVELPLGAEILTVQAQRNIPCIWAIVDTKENRFIERTFEIYGTGHKMCDGKRAYIGTFQMNEGALVFHLFEQL